MRKLSEGTYIYNRLTLKKYEAYTLETPQWLTRVHSQSGIVPHHGEQHFEGVHAVKPDQNRPSPN